MRLQHEFHASSLLVQQEYSHNQTLQGAALSRMVLIVLAHPSLVQLTSVCLCSQVCRLELKTAQTESGLACVQHDVCLSC